MYLPPAYLATQATRGGLNCLFCWDFTAIWCQNQETVVQHFFCPFSREKVGNLSSQHGPALLHFQSKLTVRAHLISVYRAFILLLEHSSLGSPDNLLFPSCFFDHPLSFLGSPFLPQCESFLAPKGGPSTLFIVCFPPYPRLSILPIYRQCYCYNQKPPLVLASVSLVAYQDVTWAFQI